MVKGGLPYQGRIPFGLSWDSTPAQIHEILGHPFEAGPIPKEDAYGESFHMGDYYFVAVYKGGSKITGDSAKRIKSFRIKRIRT